MSLNASARELLAQLKQVITQLRPEDFREPIPILSDSTLGQHIRHTLEFFLCLMDAHAEGKINYDHRRHDELIETDQKLAVNVLQSIDDFLEKELTDFPVIHEANYELMTKADVSMQSSFYRELAYNIEHAVHHMALLKVGIKDSFNHVDLPQHFGVASSTVRYRQLQN